MLVLDKIPLTVIQPHAVPVLHPFSVVLSSWLIQEVIPDWQQAASNILVAVGNKHINDIMEEILSKFQPGVLPHFFIVQTLASLSDSNGKDVFKEGKCVPIL